MNGQKACEYRILTSDQILSSSIRTMIVGIVTMAFRLSQLNTRHKTPFVPEMSESTLPFSASQHPLIAHLRDALRLDFTRGYDPRLLFFLLLLLRLLLFRLLRIFLLLLQFVALLQAGRESVVDALRQLDYVLFHEPPGQYPHDSARHD